jgi:hypothetical protein
MSAVLEARPGTVNPDGQRGAWQEREETAILAAASGRAPRVAIFAGGHTGEQTVYETCPKCGHRRAEEDPTPADRCPGCGVLFAKWLRGQLRSASPDPASPRVSTRDAESRTARVIATLTHVEPRVNAVEFWGRAAVLFGLSVWGVYFIFTDWAAESGPFRTIGNSFMHRVNLVFHEAGHVLFIPFGDFMSVLGGSLGQLIMPAVVMLTFLLRYHNVFGAVVGLWWLAQSLMDLAPYIGDARRGELMLLGGVTGMDAPGYHDWSNLLARTGLLASDRAYASVVDTAGELLMWIALAWGVAILYRQYRNIDPRI